MKELIMEMLAELKHSKRGQWSIQGPITMKSHYYFNFWWGKNRKWLYQNPVIAVAVGDGLLDSSGHSVRNTTTVEIINWVAEISTK